jgi:voltage-gated sodium channel
MQKTLLQITQSKLFERVVVVAIVSNAVVLGAETYPKLLLENQALFSLADWFFLSFFAIEIALRIAAERRQFFRGGWNWFDFFIVLVSLLPFLGNLSALRALRVLRALRLLTVVPAFRQVVGGIISKLFGQLDARHFGDLDTALLTLFQIMTLDSWNAIVRPLIEVQWYAGLFFISFVMVAVFVLLSIVIGIASEAMSTTNGRVSNEELLEEIKKLQSIHIK